MPDLNYSMNLKPVSFLTWILLFLIFACTEKEIFLESPSISVVSVKEPVWSELEIEIQINTGERQNIQEAFIELQNLTIPEKELLKRTIETNEQPVQTHKILIKIPRNHDYKITGKIKTDKYIYESEPVVFRSLKNSFRFFIDEPEPIYRNIEPGIAIHLNSEDRIPIMIDYLNPCTSKVEVKLNKSINLDHDIDLSNYWVDDGITRSGGFASLPAGIVPGEYELFIYVDGFEYKAEKRLKVLTGNWQLFNETFPGEKRGDYAWFKLENNLYVIGGSYYSASILNSPVWCLNLETGTWQQKNDFPWPDTDLYYCKIMPFELMYNNTGYIVLQNPERKLEIWKYIQHEDKWEKVTDYPGTGRWSVFTFNLDNQIFAGGGTALNGDDFLHEFWSYNLESGEWNKLKNTPVNQLYLNHSNRTVTLNGKGYIFEFPNELWEYDPSEDKWTELPEFPGPQRIHANLITFQNDLFLIGGSYTHYGLYGLKDCWQYSFSENKWEMKAFLPHYTSFGITTSWQNKIITGLGYVIHHYSYWDDPVIYQFTPEL